MSFGWSTSSRECRRNRQEVHHEGGWQDAVIKVTLVANGNECPLRADGGFAFFYAVNIERHHCVSLSECVNVCPLRHIILWWNFIYIPSLVIQYTSLKRTKINLSLLEIFSFVDMICFNSNICAIGSNRLHL